MVKVRVFKNRLTSQNNGEFVHTLKYAVKYRDCLELWTFRYFSWRPETDRIDMEMIHYGLNEMDELLELLEA